MIDEQEFHPFSIRINDIDVKNMPYTYRLGDSISNSQLKELHFIHRTFLGDTVSGILIVNEQIVQPMSEILHIAYDILFPMQQAISLDDERIQGDDLISMSLNNSSCFNDCITARNDPASLHTLGLAVDINPLLNPCLSSDQCWYPYGGIAYRDRSRVSPGMFTEDHILTQAFLDRGFIWGGLGDKPNYHHFEFTG